MEYVKLSVTPQAARQLRRVALELSEIEGRKVSQGYALEQLTGDWLAKMYRARDAAQASAEAATPGEQPEPCRQTDACCCQACMAGADAS